MCVCDVSKPTKGKRGLSARLLIQLNIVVLRLSYSMQPYVLIFVFFRFSGFNLAVIMKTPATRNMHWGDHPNLDTSSPVALLAFPARLRGCFCACCPFFEYCCPRPKTRSFSHLFLLAQSVTLLPDIRAQKVTPTRRFFHFWVNMRRASHHVLSARFCAPFSFSSQNVAFTYTNTMISVRRLFSEFISTRDASYPFGCSNRDVHVTFLPHF